MAKKKMKTRKAEGREAKGAKKKVVELQDNLEDIASAVSLAAPRRRKRKRVTAVSKDSKPVADVGNVENLGEGLSGLPLLESWLRSIVGDSVEVRSDNHLGRLGLFARRDLEAGSIAFSVGGNLTLTPEVAVENLLVTSLKDNLPALSNKENSELLMCLRLCNARNRRDDRFYAYVSNLPDSGVGVAFWPDAFREMIATTSLAPSINAADDELNRWVDLLSQVNPASDHGVTFDRTSLAWARGVLMAHRCKDVPQGMLPLLGLLSPTNSMNASVRMREGVLECICEKAIKEGDQITSNMGMNNADLLLAHGSALEENSADSVLLPVTYSNASTKAEVKTTVQLTIKGVSEKIIDQIEEEQNTPFFIALLQGVIRHRREVKACLVQLPKILNFNVCKGPLNRSRKKALENFLEAQLRILEICLEEMHLCQDDVEKEVARTQEDDSMEGAEEEEADEEEEVPEETKSWKRSRRK